MIIAQCLWLMADGGPAFDITDMPFIISLVGLIGLPPYIAYESDGNEEVPSSEPEASSSIKSDKLYQKQFTVIKPLCTIKYCNKESLIKILYFLYIISKIKKINIEYFFIYIYLNIKLLLFINYYDVYIK